MVKTINLEQIILDAYGCKDVHDFKKSFDVSIQMIKEIAMEAIRQALELASENATAYPSYDKYGDETGDAIVRKQSILDTINQIE